jgi:hypothetical protein
MIERYNGMVQRLRALERARQQRQATLTREALSATHLLLQQQQRRLAHAERLGAIGEVATFHR